MEDKNELSDIILEKTGNKTLKAKRVLIIIAILIIIFLTVILSMKLINKPTQNSEPKIILPPEPVASVQKVKKDEQLFKQVPIIKENTNKKDSFENMVKSLKEKEIQKTNKNNLVKAKKITKIVQAVVKPIVKVKAKEVKAKEVKVKEVKVKKSNSNKVVRGFYIQVGATSKYSPDKKYLKKITDKKYTYRLLPVLIKGKKITKILIGPFKTSKIARANIGDVKKSINKNAFLYRVK